MTTTTRTIAPFATPHVLRAPAWLRRKLLRLWRATFRHAERPGRFVPYC
jgi:hypothetical protein